MQGERVRYPTMVEANNDELTAEDGTSFIDLSAGYGSVLLGHANPHIVGRLERQLRRAWIVGAPPSDVTQRAAHMVDALLPSSHRMAGFYSTGMEAAELALRVARVAIGATRFVGFERGMHGKSFATSALGWASPVELPAFERLPYLASLSENEVLQRLSDALTRLPCAAVFLETIQGSGGGHTASPEFCQELVRLCRQHSALSVFDEILTGFHRTGPLFHFHDLGVVPDVVLMGKAMGNGFPVAGVSVRKDIPITEAMLPRSTFAGNALAGAAVAATLEEMGQRNMAQLVGTIGATVEAALQPLRGAGVTLRGKGALWILDLPPSIAMPEVLGKIVAGGVVVSNTDRALRLTPPATISPQRLADACGVVRAALESQLS